MLLHFTLMLYLITPAQILSLSLYLSLSLSELQQTDIIVFKD